MIIPSNKNSQLEKSKNNFNKNVCKIQKKKQKV